MRCSGLPNGGHARVGQSKLDDGWREMDGPRTERTEEERMWGCVEVDHRRVMSGSGLGRVCAGLAAAWVLAACGGSGGKSPGADARDGAGAADASPSGELDATVGDPVAFLRDHYCAAVAASLCGAGADCGCTASPLFPTGEACVEAQRARCETAVAPLEAGLRDRSLVVDASAVGACVAAHEALAAACGHLAGARIDAVCARMVYAAANVGEPCDFPLCASGAGTCQGGVCTALPGPGESCEGLCAPGLVCAGGHCVAPGDEGAACAADAACALPLVCLGGTCRRRGGPGAPCSTDEACEIGLVCQGGAGTGAAGTCAQGPATCNDPSDLCGNGTQCLFPNQFVCAPRAGVGEACQHTADCVPSAVCAAGVCEPAPGEGKACADGVYCAQGLACDFATLTCGPIPGEGAPCALGVRGPFVCAEGLTCVDGTCRTPGGKGEPCGADGRCAPGLACDFQRTGSVCVPPHTVGEPCQTDFTCADGLYCDYSRNTCARFQPEGAPCTTGNECAADLTCLPGPDGLRCRPLPRAGEPCAGTCAGDLVCRRAADHGWCLPPVCEMIFPPSN